MKTEHIYIHFPFCKKKCPYCDFFSVEGQNSTVFDKYIVSLIKEIDLYSEFFSDNIKSVYFGGGTPSLMAPDDLANLLSRFGTCGDAEVTLEVNPATVDLDKLRSFRQAGVNRLSVGSQSFIDRELKTLDRIHGVKDIYAVFEAARKAGFDNINLDLIIGIPGSSPAAVIYNAAELAALDPEHVSAYILTYYDDTEYKKLLDSGAIIKPDDDIEIEYFILTSEILKKYGYSRYEISNFSKTGRESRHNLNTWNFGNYIGLGASAHSFMNNYRWENPASLENYISQTASGLTGIDNKNIVPENILKNEFLILGLRKICGLNLNDYRNRFGSETMTDFGSNLEYYLANGTLLTENGKLTLREKRFDIFNTIVSDLIL